MSNRNNLTPHSPMDGKTHISLANGAILAVDQTPDEVADAIGAGKLGNEPFVKFTIIGLATYLSKPALELVLTIYVPPSDTIDIAKGDPASFPALRR